MEKIWFGQSREWGTGKHGYGCLVHPTSGSSARLLKHEVVVSD